MFFVVWLSDSQSLDWSSVLTCGRVDTSSNFLRQFRVHTLLACDSQINLDKRNSMDVVCSEQCQVIRVKGRCKQRLVISLLIVQQRYLSVFRCQQITYLHIKYSSSFSQIKIRLIFPIETI